MKRLKLLKKGLAFFISAALFLSIFSAPPKAALAAEGGTVVNIPDANLKAALNTNLHGSGPEADITDIQLASLEQLYVPVGQTVSDLTGLEYCTGLKTLSFSLPSDATVDLTPLAGLPLTSLRLSNGSCTNLPALPTLAILNLDNCSIDDAASISALTALHQLSISKTNLSVFPDCSAMNALTYVSARYLSSLTDISGLSNCSSLKNLTLEGCSKVTDFSPVTTLNLTQLDLDKIKITAENEENYMAAVSSQTQLTYLSLSSANLEDKHTAMLEPLTSLKTLSIGSNNLTSADFLLSHKNTLQEVSLCFNPISDSAPLGELTELMAVEVSRTYITDFSFISKLPNLTNNAIAVTEWTERFTTTSGIRIDDSYDEDDTFYTFQNVIKDENGNLIAPESSTDYSYNADTGEISIPLNDRPEVTITIRFPCTFTTQKGTTLYANPYTYLQLTQNILLKISAQPQNLTLTEGENGTLSVTASGDGTLSYQWYKDGNAISGATNSSLTLNNAALTDSGSYTVVITDKNGNLTSDAALVTVNAIPLVISAQPQSLTLTEGENGTLSVTASGNGTLSYQWYKDGNAISGATNSSLALNNAALTDSGSYTVVITDKNGNLTSNAATVTVNKKETPSTETPTETPAPTEPPTPEETPAPTEAPTQAETPAPTEAPTQAEAQPESPSTGDSFSWIIYTVLLLSAMITVTCLAGQRKREER